MQFGRISQEARDRGLAGAGRAPEHQRAQCARLQHARQRAVGAKDMVLADDIGELVRTQAIGQRTRRVLLHPCRGKERGAGFAWSFRAHPPSVTLICWPPRTSVMRHSREVALVAFSRSEVFATLVLFTARMMSPFWKPTLAAVESSAISVTTTPSVSASRCSSSATAGEMLETLAPWNGDREVSTSSLRPASGAVSSGTFTLTGFPPRWISRAEVPPSGCVAKR